MSPRHSNRDALLEGAIRCLSEQGYAAVRTRDIAAAAGANLASIGYHFGSKEQLLAEAMRESFRRWVAEFAQLAMQGHATTPRARLAELIPGLRTSLERHRGIALAFIEALAHAPRDEAVRGPLAEGYRESRGAVAALLGLSDERLGEAIASNVIATFDGLLIQWLLDPDAVPSEADLLAGLDELPRLLEDAVLPEPLE